MQKDDDHDQRSPYIDRIAVISETAAKCKIGYDGRAFSELVLVDDANVSGYRENLKAMTPETTS